MSDRLASELGALRVVQAEALGRIPKATEPIFLTPKGRPWVGQRRNALRAFRELCLRAGITTHGDDGTKVDIHALRVTYCTTLCLAGVPLPVAQKLMGHQSVEMTANIYTRVRTDDLRVAVRAVCDLEAPNDDTDGHTAQHACRTNPGAFREKSGE